MVKCETDALHKTWWYSIRDKMMLTETHSACSISVCSPLVMGVLILSFFFTITRLTDKTHSFILHHCNVHLGCQACFQISLTQSIKSSQSFTPGASVWLCFVVSQKTGCCSWLWKHSSRGPELSFGHSRAVELRRFSSYISVYNTVICFFIKHVIIINLPKYLFIYFLNPNVAIIYFNFF